tara:strand:- start:386 stop:1018 length:633 start_codon:yes stop_codon:yes gene_type:complete
MTNNNQMAFNLSTNDVYSVDWVHSAKYTKDWVSKTKKVLPPPSFIKEIMYYDSKSGFLYWKHRKNMSKTWNSRYANKKVKTNNVNCSSILYNGNRFNMVYHRLIWCRYYGEWPESNLVIDHKNGNRYDNTIENLRLVTQAENSKNRSTPKDNTSGHIGLYWRKEKKKWQVQIGLNGKIIHIGSFKNKEDAIKARKEAEKKYGFHENHGRS